MSKIKGGWSYSESGSGNHGAQGTGFWLRGTVSGLGKSAQSI